MNLLYQLRNWIRENQKSVRDDYFQFLRFASISADPKYFPEIKNCAKWLQTYIASFTQMKSWIIDTPGAPIVYAEDLRAGDAPTVLIYGHYDVQPVDPIDLWHSDPFEPVERDGKIYARGAVDDKGQIFYAITAMRAMKELGLAFGVNIKFCIEGEEESSSFGLSKSLDKIKDQLKADALLVIDFDQYGPQNPSICLGARGIAAFEVSLTNAKMDLHSGVHGGLAYNPIQALAELLAKLHDTNNRVAVDGFYDDCKMMTDAEKELFSFSFEEKSYAKEFEVGALGGEKGLSLFEKNCVRPTLEINGISGGYVGQGMKTIIPAKAIAKLSCRLVPNQDPVKIGKQLLDFLKKHVEKGVKIELKFLGGEPAFRGRVDSDLAKAVKLSCEEVTGNACKNILSGASIPIIAQLQKALETDVVGMGYCLPSDHIHAPNEHFDMERFEKGFLTVAKTFELL